MLSFKGHEYRFLYWSYNKKNPPPFGGNPNHPKQEAARNPVTQGLDKQEKDGNGYQQATALILGLLENDSNQVAEIQDPESSSEEVEYPDPHRFVIKNHDFLDPYMHNYPISGQARAMAERLYPKALQAIADFEDYPPVYDSRLSEIIEEEVAAQNQDYK